MATVSLVEDRINEQGSKLSRNGPSVARIKASDRRAKRGALIQTLVCYALARPFPIGKWVRAKTPLGQQRTLDAPENEVRCALVNGHPQPERSGPKSAKGRHFLAEKLEASSSELSGARPDQSENLRDRRGRRYVKGFIENLTQLVGAID